MGIDTLRTLWNVICRSVQRSGTTILILLGLTGPFVPTRGALAQPNEDGLSLKVDDFESYNSGDFPGGWWGLQGNKAVPLHPSMQEVGEYYAIHRDATRSYLKIRVSNESVRIVMPNEAALDWDLRSFPRLSWEWRVVEMPRGAREDKEGMDDTAGAVYVTFSFNFFGRPRSIKYTYSSTLPVGTVVTRGQLKILVVASGSDGFGEWQRMERDLAQDYLQLFGREAPHRPVSIALWSDCDSMKSRAEIDFDTIYLLPPGR